MCGSAANVQHVADPAQNGASHAPHTENVNAAGKICIKVVQISGEEILALELEPDVRGAVLRSFAAFALKQPVQCCQLFANGQELRANLSVADSGLVDGDTVTVLAIPAARPFDNVLEGVVKDQACLTGLQISLSHVEATWGLPAVMFSGQAGIAGTRGSLKPGNYYYYVEYKTASAPSVTSFELVNIHDGVSDVMWMAR
jgi:hypothetical protein